MPAKSQSKSTSHFLNTDDDPLTAALRPPASETEAERNQRLKREEAAQLRSQEIDELLRQDKEELNKKKGDVILLLLGQAESGKSTLQKQFQLLHDPKALEAERASWRTVIYFNVIHSVKRILKVLEAYDDTWDEGEDYVTSKDEDSHPVIDMSSHGNSPPVASSINLSPRSPHSSLPTTADGLRDQIGVFRRRLAPLVATDHQLADRLTGGLDVGKEDIYVRNGWQAHTAHGKSQNGRQKTDSVDDSREDPLVANVASLLTLCHRDVTDLRAYPTVKTLIAKRRLKLEEWADYFLQDISRISARDYVPSVDDILHARIQTMGIAEHTFDVRVSGKNTRWHLYDVGGARGQRHSWIPFFESANAIIFVAPISAFDQYLDEDPRTNRINDSLQLFTKICKNPLLKNVHLVLFLNKTDVLKRKLDAGQQVSKYITSYHDKANTFDDVADYFRAHFQQAHRKNSTTKRVLYTHLTSVVDSRTTQNVIANVRDSIFQGFLESAQLV